MGFLKYKHIKIILLFCAIITGLCITACSTTKDVQTKISGREWLEKQSGTTENYKKIIESTEDVYSLYVAGNMSSEDFMNELEILQQQLFYYQNDYETKKGNLIIDPEIDEVSQQGIDALESLFIDTNDLFVASVNNVGIPYSSIEVSYIYINYKDKIINDYISYKAAIDTFEVFDSEGNYIGSEAESE